MSTWLCGFVALCVQMSVAWANKVEGTMSLLLGTNEVLASKHDTAKGQTDSKNSSLHVCKDPSVIRMPKIKR